MNKNKLLVSLSISRALVISALFGLSSLSKENKPEKVEATNNIEVVKEDVDMSKVHKLKPMVVPTDTYYSTQKEYSMSNVGNIERVWDYYTGKGTTIAVIDSGIEYDHEDFFDEDGNSVISPSSAFFYVNELTNTVEKQTPYGSNWDCLKHEYFDSYRQWLDHGSNVASTAASPINALGTVGIAPEATILALKVDLTTDAINAAIRYAVDCGADVINLSLGAYDTNDPHSWDDSYPGTANDHTAAINYAYSKGVIVVASAGNESTDAKSYPACNDHVIGVGALAKNSNTTAASFSNYNKSSDTTSTNHNVDVMAPGYVYVAGLNESELSNPSKYPSNSYHSTQGTSFSSPIVAGAAALWKEKYNGSPDDFEADINNTSVNIGSYAKFGAGRLDIEALLDLDNEDLIVDSRSFRLNRLLGTQKEITAHSYNANITSWVVADPNIVSVSATGLDTDVSVATVTPLAVGSTTITVRNSNGKEVEITAEVYDEYIHVVEVTISHKRKIIGVGESFQLTAKINPDNAMNKDVIWISEDTEIATISNTGVITGLKEGRVYVEVRSVDGDKYSRCLVTVIKKDIINFGGCGGSIYSSSILLSTLCLGGISLYLISKFRRKHKQNINNNFH